MMMMMMMMMMMTIDDDDGDDTFIVLVQFRRILCPLFVVKMSIIRSLFVVVYVSVLLIVFGLMAMPHLPDVSLVLLNVSQ